eukprot:gene4662-4855_t
MLMFVMLDIGTIQVDVPDWFLAEIALLSKISSLRLRTLCQQIAKKLVGDEIEWEKVTKITNDAKFDTDLTKQALSCLEFILSNSARFDVDDKVLSDDLTKVGLPKESADSIGKAYTALKDKLQVATALPAEPLCPGPGAACPALPSLAGPPHPRAPCAQGSGRVPQLVPPAV